MSNKVNCQHCNALQPSDWKPGDFCMSCGQASRQEVHCAWCVTEVPVANFCRECGFKMVSPDLFGVARIMKDGNVDKLSISNKIAEMDTGTIAHYKSIYNKHYAIMMNRIDELRFFEKFTVYNHYSNDLQNELLHKIPFNDEHLALLENGSKGPYDGRSEKIWESLNNSPLASVKTLATLASVQLNNPEWKQASKDKLIPTLFENKLFNAKDQYLSTEYFAALSSVDALRFYINERKLNYKISNKFRIKVIIFVQQYWDLLEEKARVRVIPFLYQFSLVKELKDKQESFEKYLKKAFINENQELSFAAALSSKDGQNLLKFAHQPNGKYAIYAAEICGYYALEQACIVLLNGDDLKLKEALIGGLYENSKVLFSDNVTEIIAKKLEDYLTDGHTNKAVEAGSIVSKINAKKEKEAKKQQEKTAKEKRIQDRENIVAGAFDKIDNVESILQMFDETTEIALCNRLIEKMLFFPLNKKMVVAIKRKLIFFKLDFNEESLRKLFEFGKKEATNEVINIWGTVISQKSHSSFLALHIFWNGILFEQADEHYSEFFHYSSLSNAKYTNPKNNKIEKLAIQKEAIELFFVNMPKFVTAYLSNINRSVYAEEYYRLFWKDMESDWETLIRKDVDLKTQVLDGILTFLNNEKVTDRDDHIETKTWALEFLLNIFDLFDDNDIEKIMACFENIPAVSKTKYKGAYEYLNKLKINLLEQFDENYEVKHL